MDQSRMSTLVGAISRKSDVDSKVLLPDDCTSIPCLLVANKCDLQTAPLDDKEMRDVCNKCGFFDWMESSAKESINVNTIFEKMVQKILTFDCIKPSSTVEVEQASEDIKVLNSKQQQDDDHGSSLCSC